MSSWRLTARIRVPEEQESARLGVAIMLVAQTRLAAQKEHQKKLAALTSEIKKAQADLKSVEDRSSMRQIGTLAGVTVVCWLFGESGAEPLHGDRLESLVEYLVDTPVRGLIYERSSAHPRGEQVVARAREKFRIPCVVVSPGDDLGEAVGRVLGG